MTRSETAARFAASAGARDGAAVPGPAFRDWWEGRPRSGAFEVTRIPFRELDRWDFDRDSGDLGHESGRFFTVEGLRVDDGAGTVRTQPIINQPEVGILGILVKEFDGVLHCLMQAKFEPGNLNVRQLSPTVQATRSNYTRVHQGNPTPYVEYFHGPARGRVLVDVLQSEQGAWFWRKSNRNIVVEATGEVPENEDFCWLTLHQLRRLLLTDNLVNMDARTVLACMPLARPQEAAQTSTDPFVRALLRSYDAVDDAPEARNTLGEVISWLTDARARCEHTTQLVPLSDITGWTRSDDAISDDSREVFQIIAARVRAGNREVREWTQPLLAPWQQGLAVFVTRAIDGVLHVLVRATPEPGLPGAIEIGPTVQRRSTADTRAADPFAETALTDDPARIRSDVVLSEEGGRFHHAQTRYRVIEAGPDVPLETPDGYCWVTVGQLMDLVRHSHYLTIEARTLLACLHALW
ncbi:NDP-hexose 2,3-dehydratase family protein [Nocardiopsis ansamitocini]|uniref:NDP-hexose 2,3-dehydratase n=1 Tax=Nocardiopsis ansamitocini TaxID=1670832 RepID=A0A9W6PAK1_9ACTN|nr:NDP-hexose 2,3-dehydratase family protein [Nocardiopsis ansamitocini]GLU50023.1 NDP-hexose 2,3-dehydratase [Nocardiopsis ansamitocini]